MNNIYYYDILDYNIIDLLSLFKDKYEILKADKTELKLNKSQYKKFMIHYIIVSLMEHKLSNRLYAIYNNESYLSSEDKDIFDLCIKSINNNLHFAFINIENKNKFINNINDYKHELLISINKKKAEKISLQKSEKFLKTNDLTFLKKNVFINYNALLQLV